MKHFIQKYKFRLMFSGLIVISLVVLIFLLTGREHFTSDPPPDDSHQHEEEDDHPSHGPYDENHVPDDKLETSDFFEEAVSIPMRVPGMFAYFEGVAENYLVIRNSHRQLYLVDEKGSQDFIAQNVEKVYVPRGERYFFYVTKEEEHYQLRMFDLKRGFPVPFPMTFDSLPETIFFSADGVLFAVKEEDQLISRFSSYIDGNVTYDPTQNKMKIPLSYPLFDYFDGQFYTISDQGFERLNLSRGLELTQPFEFTFKKPRQFDINGSGDWFILDEDQMYMSFEINDFKPTNPLKAIWADDNTLYVQDDSNLFRLDLETKQAVPVLNFVQTFDYLNDAVYYKDEIGDYYKLKKAAD